MSAAKNSARPVARHAPSIRMPMIVFMIIMLLCGALFVPTAILIAGGMLPTFVAIMVDNDRKKSISITVALMNASGVVPFVIELWKKGQTLNQSLDIMHQPLSWLFMYGAAAMGWLIVYSVPAVVQAFLAHRARIQIAEIDKHHAALIQLWGEEVKGKPRDKQPPK